MACQQITRTVAAGNTDVIQTYPILDVSGALVSLTVTNPVTDKTICELIHFNYTGTPPNIEAHYVEYATIGNVSEVNFSAEVIYESTSASLQLKLTNNESSTVRVELADIARL